MAQVRPLYTTPNKGSNKFNTGETSRNKKSKMAAYFLMSCEAKVEIELPELNVTAHISAPFHVANQQSNYNVIFGRHLLQELEMTKDFQNNFVSWKETKIPMTTINSKLKKYVTIHNSKNIRN